MKVRFPYLQSQSKGLEWQMYSVSQCVLPILMETEVVWIAQYVRNLAREPNVRSSIPLCASWEKANPHGLQSHSVPPEDNNNNLSSSQF